MRAGKENNIKSRLDDLNEIPDSFHFDEYAVWQRLEARLKDQPQKKSYVWVYPVVGLCLLVVFLELGAFYVFTRNDEGFLPAKTVSIELFRSKANIQGTQTAKQEITPVIKHVDKKHDDVVQSSKVIIVPDTSKIKQTPVQEIQLAKNDTGKTVPLERIQVTAATTKRKFPIAHLNEMPGENPPIVVAEQGKTKTAFLKKKIPVIVYDPPPVGDERLIPRKKTRSLLNLKSSSQ